MGIELLDEVDLPVAPPFFQGFFALDREVNITEVFEPDEPVHTLSFAESRNLPFFVLTSAGNDVASHADLECAVWFARHDANSVGTI